METNSKFDCIVIGAGMYGLFSAFYLAEKGFKVAIIEKENDIFDRASKVNQSRLHRGYHYPRCKNTAKNCDDYYHRFIKDFGFSLIESFEQYYSVAKDGSLISAEEYRNFCKSVEIPFEEVNPNRFFKTGYIDTTFKVDEQCFDFLKIRDYWKHRLFNQDRVKLFTNSSPVGCEVTGKNYVITLNSGKKLTAPIVINATYNYVNEINRLFGVKEYKTKYELCQLMIFKNIDFANTGVIVMDGEFFSVMPFGDGSYFSLWSVKDSPISTSFEKCQIEELYKLKSGNNKKMSKQEVDKNTEQARNFLKDGVNFEFVERLYEIKPILIENETDDGRPTLIDIHSNKPYFMSVLSGKISTFYKMEEYLDTMLNI